MCLRMRLITSVTAVGGTHLIPEVAVGFSGGGFSNYVRDCVFCRTVCITYAVRTALVSGTRCEPLLGRSSSRHICWIV